MRPIRIKRLLRQSTALTLIAFMMLVSLPNDVHRTAKAFMPGVRSSNLLAGSPLSHTHLSITWDVLNELSREFFSIRLLNQPMRSAITSIAAANKDVDNILKEQFGKAASHFDGESFPESQDRLVKYSLMVQDLLKKNAPEEARWHLGQALHTLQDFYSHSNWVELGNTDPFERLGVRGDPLDIRPPATHNTCAQCARNDCPDCTGILTTNRLTTGYYGGDDRPKPHRFKCSHGGRFDESAEGAFGSGINKDTRACPLSPHWELHEQAAEIAKEATKLYVRRIKNVVGIDRMKKLFGVGPTLAFAIDTTGSMGTIIERVQQQTVEIIDSRIGTDEEPSKYVLLTYNDPSIDPVFETDDAEEFKRALNSLTAEGGGDCPEPSMAGMLQAIEAVDSGGELYLFTDAGANDGHLASSVAGLAQSKGIKISPFLFGTCSPINPAYFRVADESGGQLHFLAREDAGGAVKLVDFRSRTNTVNLLSVTNAPESLPQTYRVPVDSTMTSVTFSVSGGDNVTITRPDGTTLQDADEGVSALRLFGATVHTVSSPQVGIWSVRVNSVNHFIPLKTYNVTVTGESPISFDEFRFVEVRGRPGHEDYFPINGLPLAGAEGKVSASLTAERVATARFELRRPDGSLLQTLDMEELQSPDPDPVLKEFFGSLKTPSAPFIAYVTGEDAEGRAYQRMAAGVVKPQTVKISAPGLDELSPGQTKSYALQVTNYGPADTFRFTADDDKKFIASAAPLSFALGTKETREVAVILKPPVGTPRGTLDNLVFSVQSASNPDVNNRAVVTAHLAPGADLALGMVVARPEGGDGDAFVEPGETATLSVELNNVGIDETRGFEAVLSSATPGVEVLTARAAYPAVQDKSAALNSSPFRFRLSKEFPCGGRVEFKLNLLSEEFDPPLSFNFPVDTGEATATLPVSYKGPPVAIPDASPAGVSIPIEVSGVSGGITDLNFRFDGSQCTDERGATTVGLDHSWVGDLVVTLTSPEGTTVTLLERPGLDLFGSPANNFCNTLFDDEGGGKPIKNVVFSDAPHAGTFTPTSPLSAFKGEDANGTWTLKVVDAVGGDTGNVRAFTLFITGANCDSTGAGDATAPTTSAVVSPQPNAANWHNGDVSVRLSAQDDGGSGVRHITYEARGAENLPLTTVDGGVAVVDVRAEGETTLRFFATDNAGNAETAQSLTLRIDKTPPDIAITSPSGSYLLRQPVSALFTCTDLLSGAASCNGARPEGSVIDTSTPGSYLFDMTASDAAGNSRRQTSSYSVGYRVKLLYDPNKAHQSGSTIPIKLQLTDAEDVNVSSTGVVVTALSVTKLSDNSTGDVADAGNANPDSNFRFTNFNGAGGYIFNLKTTGMTKGTYAVNFKAGSDPTAHTAPFQIR